MDNVAPDDDGASDSEPTGESAPEDDELMGRTLEDRFRIEELIGTGGMGRVYRGAQLSVDRDVAIKVLHGELSLDDELKKRFFREANVVSDFTHPNIVRLIDFGKDEEFGVLYLVMELVDGLGLDEVLEHGRLHPELATRVAYQTAGALVEAHSAGVIHRDLKAENLLLSAVSDGTLQTKVVDFGIAYPEQASEKLTRTGRIYGTASYMAPEQARGKQVDQRADLFSLGVLMFEMLTGKLPISGTSSMDVMIKQIQEGPPPLSQVVPRDELPDAIFGLVDQLLSGSADDRPADASDVRATLQEVFRQEGWQPIRIETDHPNVERLERWLLEPYDIDENQTVERPQDGERIEQSAPSNNSAGSEGAAQTEGDAPTADGAGSSSGPPPEVGTAESAHTPSLADEPATPGVDDESNSGSGLVTAVIVLGVLLIVLVPIALYTGLVVLAPESDSGLDEVAAAAADAATATGTDAAPAANADAGAGGEEDPVCGTIDRKNVPGPWRGNYNPQGGDGEQTLKVRGEKLNLRWDDGGATAWLAKSSRPDDKFEVECARISGMDEGTECSGSIRRRGPILMVRMKGGEFCEERLSGNWVGE